mmetsp:Transcript_24789/g.54141  ORF Transcript_24789/g.54141 Transcript_24789/m.54141 type:complete len:266 (-) Transcript_24789:459-1256(-)
MLALVGVAAGAGLLHRVPKPVGADDDSGVARQRVEAHNRERRVGRDGGAAVGVAQRAAVRKAARPPTQRALRPLRCVEPRTHLVLRRGLNPLDLVHVLRKAVVSRQYRVPRHLLPVLAQHDHALHIAHICRNNELLVLVHRHDGESEARGREGRLGADMLMHLMKRNDACVLKSISSCLAMASFDDQVYNVLLAVFGGLAAIVAIRYHAEGDSLQINFHTFCCEPVLTFGFDISTGNNCFGPSHFLGGRYQRQRSDAAFRSFDPR